MLGNYTDVEVLIGKTLNEINVRMDEINFYTTDGDAFKMFHSQDCCEDVFVEEVIGDFEDLIDSPITMAEETSENCDSSYGSGTWTFYKFATNKGYVTIRWLGESNGYYSESVSFLQLEKEENLK